MVIDEFHVGRTLSGPAKAHTKLIVDADAVLLFPFSLQCLKAIASRVFLCVVNDFLTLRRFRALVSLPAFRSAPQLEFVKFFVPRL